MKQQTTIIQQKEAALVAVGVFIALSIMASFAAYYLRSVIPLTFILVAVVMAIRELKVAMKYAELDKESCDVPSHNSDHVQSTRRQGFSHRENRQAYEVD